MKPKISVITPVYNGEQFVRRCYWLLTLQTYTNWEWVVVNDGSTDNTLNVLKSINDDRVVIVSYNQNMGRGFARARALEVCTGEWIAIWDIDDMYFTDRLEVIYETMKKGYDFLCSYAVLVDNNLEIKSVRGFHKKSNALPKYFVHPTLACKASIMKMIGYDPNKRTGEDAKMIFSLAENYNGLFYEDALAIYQEDREVNLNKAISSNLAQYNDFKAMYKNKTLKLSLLNYIWMVVRWNLKLIILHLLKIYPKSYLWTVKYRDAGEKSSTWTLSDERKSFIEFIKENEGHAY